MCVVHVKLTSDCHLYCVQIDPSCFQDVKYILVDPSCSGSGILNRIEYDQSVSFIIESVDSISRDGPDVTYT